MTAPNFDRLARPYRWLEYISFGPLLHRTRCAFLPQLAGVRHALILGDGDGRFTAQLLRANPHVRVTAVDGSPAMLSALMRNAAGNAARVTAVCADLRHWRPQSSPETAYDLIATHFFLDCLTTADVAALAQRIRPALASRALWAVSDFAIPATRFGRFIAAPLVALLYRAFGVLTGLRIVHLPDHSAALTGAGFTLQDRTTRLYGLLFSELWRSPVN
jgi:hypothetical protein